MVVVVASYRQNVHAYLSGGGDYEVATVNLGHHAGLTVASALLVDYVLTVAVSISSGIANVATSMSFIRGHEAMYAVIPRHRPDRDESAGVRESGKPSPSRRMRSMAGVIGMGPVRRRPALLGVAPAGRQRSLELVAAPARSH